MVLMAQCPSAYGEVFSRMSYSTRPALTGAILALAVSNPAWAYDQAEWEKLSQCARELCTIIVAKDAKGPDLSCDLVKTWAEEDIQKGADYKNLSWGFGSARCTAKFAARRADLVAALTLPEYTFKAGKQSFACEIGEEKYTISGTLAPELVLKDGKAVNGAVHLDDIEGSALIKGVVWTAAALERNFGLFESDLVREANRFMRTECPKVLSSAPPPKKGKHK
jgi:hypothetical protein